MHPYIKAILGALLLFFVITLYALEFSHFSQTFNIKSLIFTALAIGFLIGCVLANTYRKKMVEQVDKMAVIFGSIILSMLIMPLVMSLSNRLLSFNKAVDKKYEFIKEEAFGSSRFGMVEGMNEDVDGYHIFFVRDGIYERIKSDKPLFDDVKKGTSINLPVKRGLFGWEFVDL